MTEEQLKEGQELVQLIKVTESAINNLKLITPKDRNKEKIYDDKLYSLSISEYKDGSGKRGELNRYDGNEKLLNVIIIELERQLLDFKSKLERL